MLKKLKVMPKLVLLVSGVAVPLVAVTLFAVLTGINRDLRTTQREKQGNTYQRPLAGLLDQLPQHQWYASAMTRGDQTAKTHLLEKEVEIDQLFADLDTAQAKYGQDLQCTDTGLSQHQRTGLDPRTLKANWQKLKATPPTAATLADNAEQHRQLVATVRSLISHTGDTSHLLRDPDLDTGHLTDATLLALPQTQERLGHIITYGHDTLRKDAKSLTPKELAQFSTYAAVLKEADVDRIRASVQTALNEHAHRHGSSPTLQHNLTEPLQTYTTANTELLNLLNTASANATNVTADALLTAGTAARSAAYRLWKASADELDGLLTQRATTARWTRFWTILATVLALGVGVGVAYYVARDIVRPLSGLTQATQRLARGEANVRAPVYGADEIGALATSFNAMLSTRNKTSGAVEAENKRLQTNIQELLVVVSDASDGKLGVRARVGEGVLGNVCDALNLMLENVGGIIANAKSASDQVAVASTGISTVAAELEKGEARQTAEILTTSEGVRDLNGQAQKVLANCQAATQAAENGRKAAEQGAKAVREVIRGMEKIRENTQANAKKIKRLGDRSMEISGIVKVIGDISAKTDMLALNASIEAARAGEQGKGFTIVAEQVRSLADRTKTLTNQIEKLVTDIQKETGEAVAQMETQTQEVEAGARAAQSAGGTLENIVSVSSESSELVSQINQSASQQATRTQEMLATVENISQVVSEAAVKVRETRSTSEQLLALSAELNKRLAQFEVAEDSAVYEQSAA